MSGAHSRAEFTSDRLLRAQFGMHGELIALLRSSGFEIEELVEFRPPDGATNVYHPQDSLEWAQRWPCEDVWKVRRRS